MKIIIVNGPNLNMLNLRDQSQYGAMSLEEINSLITSSFPNVEFEFFQSNHEGEIVDYLNLIAVTEFDGLVINPAAYSHYSIAIHDALEIINQQKVEVHLSKPKQREAFRHNLITAKACDSVISGLYEQSYIEAVKYILKNAS